MTNSSTPTEIAKLVGTATGPQPQEDVLAMMIAERQQLLAEIDTLPISSNDDGSVSDKIRATATKEKHVLKTFGPASDSGYAYAFAD